MALSPGARLGPYEISAQLGVGGMGEVYRATDTNLKRQVAIKVLPESVAGDAERLARFQREAEVLAQLNHPNIAQIHGLERADGQTALVLELVEGPTLADRIVQGAIPVDEALAIARQIAEALEAAHEQGIIHRDLKPANVKVRHDGTVKVLDFGLAKATESASPRSASASMTPTITTPAMTQMGMILGTAAYMSPEQARGKTLDRRTDIWAFGCVLFEMVTGRRAFEGEDVTETLASVVKMPLDLGSVAPRLRPLISRCLEKDPRKRLRDIGDWSLLVGEDAAGRARSSTAPSRTRWVWPAVAAVLAVAAAISFWAPWRIDADRAPTRLKTFPAGPDPRALVGIAASPDGRSVVIAAGQLWLWSLDSLEAKPIPDTEGAGRAFWSPDSRSLAFATGGQLRRIDLDGGPPQTIISRGREAGRGLTAGYEWGAWNRNGVLLFRNTDGGLSRAPARGGDVRPVVMPAGKAGHLDLPVFLPDDTHFLYLDHTAADDKRGIYVGSIESSPDEQPATPVLRADDGPLLVRDARWDNPQIVFLRQGELLAQPFDTNSLKPVGDAIPIATGVSGGQGNGWFSSSANGGVLLYLPGFNNRVRRLVWVDRKGAEEPINVPPREYVYAQLSPDGRRVVLDSLDEEQDIWVWDFARATLQRLTFGPERDSAPVWSSDGRRIAFAHDISGKSPAVYWQAADGSGVPQLLLSRKDWSFAPTGFSPDGKTLLANATDFDLWKLSVGGAPDEATALLSSPAREGNAVVSPDGRWLAYQSDESGQFEVHVRPFSDVASGHWQISTAGGTHPLWSRDGRELFFYAPEGAGGLMAVRIEAGAAASFAFGRPERLFQTNYPAAQPGNDGRQTYDVSLDGERFLMLKPVNADAAAAGVVVVQNAFDALMRRGPAK